jgi:hypothetical protein
MTLAELLAQMTTAAEREIPHAVDVEMRRDDLLALVCTLAGDVLAAGEAAHATAVQASTQRMIERQRTSLDTLSRGDRKDGA